LIHAVGPVWAGGNHGEADQLAGAYRRSLELAVEHRCNSIAFPAISIGVYGYPMDLASRTALNTVCDFVVERNSPSLVRFVLFGPGAYGAFSAALEELKSRL
jgi:O-acetyl-ADP-ribose deacetylase (regulator of RNase III)